MQTIKLCSETVCGVTEVTEKIGTITVKRVEAFIKYHAEKKTISGLTCDTYANTVTVHRVKDTQEPLNLWNVKNSEIVKIVGFAMNYDIGAHIYSSAPKTTE